ncbi:MAG: antibiotic biosynthesis monooxygenase [Marinifilaceae bacterium]|nr:antibiotic biosynthesis monooxygenase [Marinifilaceae bacterium]
MTIEYNRYKVTLEQRGAFIESYKKASKQLDISEFCKDYDLTECEEETGQFILRIEWTSTKEHLNGFRKSNVFPAFFANVKPFFDNIQEMRHYKLIEVSKVK